MATNANQAKMQAAQQAAGIPSQAKAQAGGDMGANLKQAMAGASMAQAAPQGNDYYTGDQVKAFQTQLAEKQKALAGLSQSPKIDLKPGDVGYGIAQSIANGKNKQQAATLNKEIAQLQAQITGGADLKNADGSPVKQRFQGIANADGSLKDQYVMKDWQNVNPDVAALNKFKETALRDAGQASPWAKLALEKQQQEQTQAMDQAAQMQASGYNQALSGLAQTGGLSGAARERMQRSSMNNGLLQRQQALRQGQMDRSNIGLQDEQNRMSGLSQLQGMQNQQADIQFKNQEMQQGVDKLNLQNRLGEVDKKRMYDLETYKQQMQTWGANKTADAQAKAAASAGGGKK